MTYSPFEYDSHREDDHLSAAEELELYMQLKAQESELKDRLALQKEKVREIVMWETGDKIEDFAGYEFTIGTRKTWEYSEEVIRVAEDLKAMKGHEQRHGIARQVDGSVFPVMRRAKP